MVFALDSLEREKPEALTMPRGVKYSWCLGRFKSRFQCSGRLSPWRKQDVHFNGRQRLYSTIICTSWKTNFELSRFIITPASRHQEERGSTASRLGTTELISFSVRLPGRGQASYLGPLPPLPWPLWPVSMISQSF